MSVVNLEEKYVRPFIDSIHELFTTMLDLEPKDGKPFFDNTPNIFEIGIAANIGISGNIKGSISLLLTEEIALELTSRFMDDEYTEINDFVKSTIGELTNIIVGGAKKQFLNNGMDFKISIPNLFIGKINEIYTKDSIPSLYIPFSLEKGSFYLKICIEQNKECEEEHIFEKYSDHDLQEKLGELLSILFERGSNHDDLQHIAQNELLNNVKQLIKTIEEEKSTNEVKENYYNLGKLLSSILELSLNDEEKLDDLRLSSLSTLMKSISSQ